MTVRYKISDKSSKFLIPDSNGGNIDVTQMAWTVTPKSGRTEIPSATLIEYQQSAGQLISSIANYTKAGIDFFAGTSEDSRNNAYLHKYFANPTGFVYKIPFFSETKYSKTNDFGGDDKDSISSILSGITGTGGSSNKYSNILSTLSVAKTIVQSSMASKLNFENPQHWTSSSVPSIKITWDLHNTGSVEDIVNNRNLAYILNYQNSPSRKNAILMDPPVIYTLHIPDCVHMPACFVDSLEITNLGNTWEKVLPNSGSNEKRIIPEAYRFNISFKSLLMDTRNMQTGMDDGKFPSAITDSKLLEDFANVLSELEATKNEDIKNRALSLANRLSSELGFPLTPLINTVNQTAVNQPTP